MSVNSQILNPWCFLSLTYQRRKCINLLFFGGKKSQCLSHRWLGMEPTIFISNKRVHVHMATKCMTFQEKLICNPLLGSLKTSWQYFSCWWTNAKNSISLEVGMFFWFSFFDSEIKIYAPISTIPQNGAMFWGRQGFDCGSVGWKVCRQVIPHWQWCASKCLATGSTETKIFIIIIKDV